VEKWSLVEVRLYLVLLTHLDVFKELICSYCHTAELISHIYFPCACAHAKFCKLLEVQNVFLALDLSWIKQLLKEQKKNKTPCVRRC